MNQGLASSTATVAAANLVSRVTGFARVLAVGAVLGVSYLGNTYQSANVVPNVVFELLAAGSLSAVLMPVFVGLDARRPTESQRLAGSVLGVALCILGAVVVLGVAMRRPIMTALTAAVEDPDLRRRQIELGSFLLVVFLPQLLLYAIGAVATALLHARQRFAAAAVAPVANNLVVMASLAAFWAVGPAGAAARIDLDGGQRWILALGTTAGVAAMTALPLVALRRAGLRLRPSLDLSAPGLRSLRTSGSWASLHLALGQLLILATVVLANRIEGGVVVANVGYQLFLLPFALLAHPVITTLYPRLSASLTRGESAGPVLDSGVRVLAMALVPATVLVVVVAPTALQAVQLGGLDRSGLDLAGRVVLAYSAGIVGWAALALFTRASYAMDDTRTPALVMLGVAGGGSVLMVLASSWANGDGAVVALAAAHSVAVSAGGLLLGLTVRHRTRGDQGLGHSLLRTTACSVVALAVASGLHELAQVALGTGPRLVAGATAAVTGAAGAGAFLATRAVVATIRPHPGDPEGLVLARRLRFDHRMDPGQDVGRG